MKKFLLPAVAAVLGCSAAAAGPITHTVTLNASVASVCNINGTPTSTSSAFEDMATSTSKFTATVSNGIAQVTTGTLRFPNVSCNGSAIKVSLDPGGKPIITGDGTNANQKIHYQAVAYNSDSAELVKVVTTNSVSETQYKSALYANGSIDIKISIIEGITTLVAGEYTGTLKINFDTV